MTVKQLIERLSAYDPNLEIAIKWDGGLADPDDIVVDEEDGNEIVVIDCSIWGTFYDRHNP